MARSPPPARPGGPGRRTPPAGAETIRRPPIDSLTGLRGLAALWVVAYHFGGDLVALLPAAAPLAPLIGEGHHAVPVFFALSGYVLAYNHLDALGRRPGLADLGRFWARRLRRIYPLHLATLLAVLAMVAGARRAGLSISGSGYGAADFARNLLLVQAWTPRFRLTWNYPSWSISSEWFAYLAFPAACAALARVRRGATLAALAAAAYGAEVGLSLAGDRVPFRGLLAVVGPFLLGCVAARAVDLGHAPRRPGAAAWALAAAAAAIPYAVASPRARSVALLTAGAGLVYALGAAGRGGPRLWRAGPLLALGEASYSLYMVHALVQKLANELAPAPRFSGRSLAVRLAVAAGYAAALAASTWAAYALVEAPFRAPRARRPGVRPPDPADPGAPTAGA